MRNFANDMKQTILTMLMMLLSLGIEAQEEHNVIYDQPDGELRIYNRQGYVIHEDEYTGDISVQQQSGTISIVFAPDGQHVYLQDPVSTYTYGGSWVEGTLSADGRSFSVPTGQYVDYTRSFDMAYQMQVLTYDETTASASPTRRSSASWDSSSAPSATRRERPSARTLPI